MAHVEDVMLVIDTQTLLEQTTDPSQDVDNPTEVSNPGLCFLAAPPHLGGCRLATASLEINLGDGGATADISIFPHIRWRVMSLSADCHSTAIIYRVDPATESGQGRMVLTAGRAFERRSQAPLPDLVGGENADPPSFSAVEISDYYLETRLRDRGSAPVAFSFYVTLDDDVGKPALAGYFLWRATITVS